MSAKIKSDICGPQVKVKVGKLYEAWAEVWDLSSLGTKQLRLHSQREPHTGEKPLGAEYNLSRMEMLEETKREIWDGNEGREQRVIISECTV